MIISLGRRLPDASSDLPGSHPDRANPPSPFFPCGQSGGVAPLFGLAPSGVCQAKPVTRPAGELLPHRFTLTPASRSAPWRSVFCGTFPSRDQSGGGRYPPPRPTESGLSSTACPQIDVSIKSKRRGDHPVRHEPITHHNSLTPHHHQISSTSHNFALKTKSQSHTTQAKHRIYPSNLLVSNFPF